MPANRNLKIAFTTLISIVCITGVSWWIHISFTFVPFEPVAFNDKKEPVSAEVPGDFYKNLRVVLDGYHITYKLDILNHPLVPLKIAGDKELMGELTEKAQDIMWLYHHTKEKHSSFPCGGEGYQGYVFGLAEQVLRTQIEATGGIHARSIDYELPSYYRQYLGYRNARGEVVVYINLVHKHSATLSGLQDDLYRVKDGGSSYWNADVNLQQKTIDVAVNGYAALYHNHP